MSADGYARIHADPTLSPAQREQRIELYRTRAREWQRAKRERDRASREAGIEPADAERERERRRKYNAEYRARHREQIRKTEKERVWLDCVAGIEPRKHRPTGAEAIAERERKNAERARREAEDAALGLRLERLHAASRERQDVRGKIERLKLDERVGVVASAIADRQLRELAKRESILALEVRETRALIGLPAELEVERTSRHSDARGGGEIGPRAVRAAARHYKARTSVRVSACAAKVVTNTERKEA